MPNGAALYGRATGTGYASCRVYLVRSSLGFGGRLILGLSVRTHRQRAFRSIRRAQSVLPVLTCHSLALFLCQQSCWALSVV